MKSFISAALFAFSSCALAAPAVPSLNQIHEATLFLPYSCGGSYAVSALFLSPESESMNAPELLYNGACGSSDYIEAVTAGDDFALVADLGDVPLETASASKAFNWQRTSGQDNVFRQTQPIKQNHTYAVLISKARVRALYVLKVVSQTQDGRLVMRYAVKSYSLQSSRAEAPGFDWEIGNRK